ncbi:MAG: HAMP domain-containing sensor histidine kinase [Chloroflexota bacterium]
MNLSLRSRLWLSFGFVILLMALIIGVTMLVFVARGNLVSRLQLQAVVAQLSQRQNIPIIKAEAAQQAVERISEAVGMRVLAIDQEGLIKFDSGIETEAEFSGALRIPSDPRRDIFLIKDLEGNQWLYTGRPVQNGYTLIVAIERQPLREVIGSPVTAELLQALMMSAFVGVGLSMLLAVWITHSVASPLQKISAASQKIAVGELTKITPEGPREVWALGEAFNEMADQVFASQNSQRDFVANVSHELKTPLTSVQGFAQAILDGTVSSPGDQKQAAQVIYDEAGRMHRMVLDLLDLAKLDAGTADFRRERLDLSPLLQRVIEKFSPQALEAQVALNSQIDPLPAMIGDGDRLVQVFTNLVDNALKHTPPGGQVTLAASVVNQRAEISITDSGTGIPPDELSRIFERFYQMDKSRKGGDQHSAGLGLAIAQEIVEAHGGGMSAHSQMGQGSSFTVWLPFAKPDDETLVIQTNK